MLLLGLLSVVGELSTNAGEKPTYESILIEGVPQVRQKPDFCGEACVEMWLRKLGKGTTQDEVFNASGLDPSLGRGCYAQELLRAVTQVGFKPCRQEEVFNIVKAERSAEDLERCFRCLHNDLRGGVPSIVCMRYNATENATEHFRLVIGYDAKSDEVVYREPAWKSEEYGRMEREHFLKLWPLKQSKSEWTVVLIRLEAAPSKIKAPERKAGAVATAGGGERPAQKQPTVFQNADFAQRVRSIKAKCPQEGLNFIVEQPFVIVGDCDQDTLRSYAKNVVRWSVDLLKKSYFQNDPSRILAVWLLSNPKSYERYCMLITKSKPITPYGFYSTQHDALVMNIQTGGGTLVHEIVHPFIEANFPGCPPWFNEGLGSLYEQCEERDGRIVGLLNWRLAGLKKAIAQNDLPDFKTLTGYSGMEFHNIAKGNNYAQARYLCYYLQEKGLLEGFYKDFLRRRIEDPTGYATLSDALGKRDMRKFKEEWQRFVTGLATPQAGN